MSLLKRFPVLVLSQILRRTPISVLRFIEQRAQFYLGKGWGTESTTEEVRAISYFVKCRGIETVLALDVGANIGNWSSDLLSIIPEAKIIAFEPSSEAFNHLQRRFSNNKSFSCHNMH